MTPLKSQSSDSRLSIKFPWKGRWVSNKVTKLISTVHDRAFLCTVTWHRELSISFQQSLKRSMVASSDWNLQKQLKITFRNFSKQSFAILSKLSTTYHLTNEISSWQLAGHLSRFDNLYLHLNMVKVGLDTKWATLQKIHPFWATCRT